MRKADRLFEIIQLLRQATTPLTADVIAAELEIGRRTIYRDIAALIARRVPIRGEAGVGYVLERGFDLPPLMLNVTEVEAVTLGAQWVIGHGDTEMARAALSVLAKVAAVLPQELAPLIDDPAVGTLPVQPGEDEIIDFQRLRRWCREGRKIVIDYGDESGNGTSRTIWPILIGYVAKSKVVIAWCEMREDFRVFRHDRITSISFLDVKYPERPASLRSKWRKIQGEPARTRGF